MLAFFSWGSLAVLGAVDETSVLFYDAVVVAAFIQWLTSARKTAFTPPGQALQIPCEYRGIPLVSDLSVKAAHELGLEMFVWTVNDTDEMARLLTLGVDGIITDYPARLRGLIQRGRS
jgi:glycerophosphoryl diester phosphodiesterase